MAIFANQSSSSCDASHADHVNDRTEHSNVVIVEDPIALLTTSSGKKSSIRKTKSLLDDGIPLSSSSSACSVSSTVSTDSTSSPTTKVDNDVTNNKTHDYSTSPLVTDGEDPWSVYDRIVCLNLRERVDRYEHMKNELSRIGMFERVQFRFSDRSPYGGTYGCFESHWKAIQDAYNDGKQNLLIFEDDVQFKDGYEEVMNDCYTFIKNDIVHGWEFLCLNGILFYGVESSSTLTPQIIMGKTIFAHAVCISRHGMERFLREYPQPTGAYNVDHAYSQCFHRHYVHIKYDTIVQLMETLGSDNQWEEIHRVKEADTSMHKYLQEIYMPHFFYIVTMMNVLLFYLLPFDYRPWLIANTMCAIPRHDIRIYRNGQNESFRWNDYSIGVLLLNLIGGLTIVRLHYYGQLPRGMNLYRMVRALFKAKDSKDYNKPSEKKIQ